ncbi:hypothetical protein HY572_03805 [Candidatus Micrarchaeota archaeon]|nr:hypothetical protein [Candidatus Micrarchaeota archaeon]
MKPKTPKTKVTQDAQDLLEHAKHAWPHDPEKAVRLVKKARRLAMKHRVHLDAKSFCRKCHVPFASDTLLVRQNRRTQTVLYACRKCNTTRRIPYKRKPIHA